MRSTVIGKAFLEFDFISFVNVFGFVIVIVTVICDYFNFSSSRTFRSSICIGVVLFFPKKIKIVFDEKEEKKVDAMRSDAIRCDAISCNIVN